MSPVCCFELKLLLGGVSSALPPRTSDLGRALRRLAMFVSRRAPITLDAADLPSSVAFVEEEGTRRRRRFLEAAPRIVVLLVLVLSCIGLYSKWDPHHYKAGAMLKVMGIEVKSWDKETYKELDKTIKLYSGGTEDLVEKERKEMRERNRKFKQKLEAQVPKDESPPPPPAPSAQTQSGESAESKVDKAATDKAATDKPSEGGLLDDAAIKAVEESAPRQV